MPKYLVRKDDKYLSFAPNLDVIWVDSISKAWHYSVRQIAADIANNLGGIVVEVYS